MRTSFTIRQEIKAITLQRQQNYPEHAECDTGPSKPAGAAFPDQDIAEGDQNNAGPNRQGKDQGQPAFGAQGVHGGEE